MPWTQNASLAIAVACLALVFAATAATAGPSDANSPGTQPATDPVTWHKLKTADGIATSKTKFIKFQPTTRTFRVRIQSAIRGEPTAARLFVALMCETVRDVEDKPVNWKQVEILIQGKPGRAAYEHEFDLGLDDSGQPRWFQLALNGQNATYDVLVEDRGATGRSKGKSSKSKQSE